MKDEDRRAALEILAERLGREDIPGVIADDSLIKDYLGTAYVTDDEEHWGEAERETRRLLNVYFSAPGGSRPPGRGEGEGTHAPPAEVAVEPSENATKRAQAFSELASALAENHPDIKEFRRKHLRDRLLTDDKARTFLDRHDGPDGPSWIMRELRKLAELLAYTYRWREGDAIWFVLTGHAPPVRPLEVWVHVNQASRFPGIPKTLIQSSPPGTWTQCPEPPTTIPAQLVSPSRLTFGLMPKT